MFSDVFNNEIKNLNIIVYFSSIITWKFILTKYIKISHNSINIKFNNIFKKAAMKSDKLREIIMLVLNNVFLIIL